ncbi:hypothetical protein D3C81_1895180 [compost metagenome]
MLADKSGVAGFFSEPVQLFFREVRFLVTSKRDVELSTQIIPAQAVITVAVQIEKQQRAAIGIGTGIKLFAQLVKAIRLIELIGEKKAGIAHEIIRTQLNDVIQVDKIAVDVGENIGVVLRVQED